MFSYDYLKQNVRDEENRYKYCGNNTVTDILCDIATQLAIQNALTILQLDKNNCYFLHEENRVCLEQIIGGYCDDLKNFYYKQVNEEDKVDSNNGVSLHQY